MSTACTSCGARLSDDAAQCDLCGTPVAGKASVAAPAAASSAAPVAAAASAATSTPATSTEPGVFCNQCGWRNPAESRFCSKCGTALQSEAATADAASAPAKSAAATASGAAAASAPAKPAESSAMPPAGPSSPAKSEKGAVSKDSEVGRRIGIIVGAGVLVVLALFVITAMSKSDQTSSSPTTASAPAAVAPNAPLADQFKGQESELRNGLDALQGAEREARLRQLVDLYISAGRYDMAGKEANGIAELTGTEADWVLAGNLFYDWMDRQVGPTQTMYSKLATNAYREALALNPDNLDVRTDMAVALLYDPEGAMLAIQETNAVLEVDSLHAQANFNRGIMLMQIGRVQQAAAQFEKVLRITSDPQDPIRMRAQEALMTIQGAQ